MCSGLLLRFRTGKSSTFLLYPRLSISHRNGWADSGAPPSPRGGYRGSNGYDRGGRGNFSTNTNRSPSVGGVQNNWATPAPAPNWAAAPSAPRDSGPRESFGYGAWRDGKHVVGGRNMRMEKELFGDASDPLKQHTGINFEKYEDIPVEATGAGVPDPVQAFTNPPLDPVLLENIGYAMYATPTPVQKYSIPIVAGGRDLMACAQVSIFISQ